jgi:hypothetical protein
MVYQPRSGDIVRSVIPDCPLSARIGVVRSLTPGGSYNVAFSNTSVAVYTADEIVPLVEGVNRVELIGGVSAMGTYAGKYLHSPVHGISIDWDQHGRGTFLFVNSVQACDWDRLRLVDKVGMSMTAPREIPCPNKSCQRKNDIGRNCYWCGTLVV